MKWAGFKSSVNSFKLDFVKCTSCSSIIIDDLFKWSLNLAVLSFPNMHGMIIMNLVDNEYLT